MNTAGLAGRIPAANLPSPTQPRSVMMRTVGTSPREGSMVLKDETDGILKRFRRDERGAISVLTALLVTALVGMMALGLEVGYWYMLKRNLRTAADAAALSAALDYVNGKTSDAALVSAAQNALTKNGMSLTCAFGSSAGGCSVQRPPSSGANTGNSSAVEVTLTQPVGLLFASAFMDAFDLDARSVAGPSSSAASGPSACILALDTSGSAFSLGGNGTVNIDNCWVASNSTAGTSIEVYGSGSLVTDCYRASGGVSGTSAITTDAGCTPLTNASAVSDPYSSLTAPSTGACDYTTPSGGISGTVTIGPSSPDWTTPYVICNGLWAKGTVTLRPGLYIITGGDFKTNSGAVLTGSGVTLILKGGAKINNFNGSSTVNLSAPTSGSWAGILMYQDRSESSCTGNNCNQLNGNSSSTFQGGLYFPQQEVHLNGGNTTTGICLHLVAKRIGFNGSANFYADHSGCSAIGVSTISVTSTRAALME